MGVAGPLPPSGLNVIGPLTLLMLGQGSPPILNMLNFVCMGELSPVVISSYQKKKKNAQI